MYLIDALSHFKTRYAISKALRGHRHKSAIYQWPLDGLVPLAAAVILQEKSRGKLPPINFKLYESAKRYREDQRARARDVAQARKVIANAPRTKPV
jgi:hypothetical protein